MQDAVIFDWGDKGLGKLVVRCRFQRGSGVELESDCEIMRVDEVKDFEAVLAQVYPS